MGLKQKGQEILWLPTVINHPQIIILIDCKGLWMEVRFWGKKKKKRKQGRKTGEFK